MSENYLQYTKQDLYKIMPDLDSMIGDLEQCQQLDDQSWKRYLRNPTPYVMDLISDFAQFPNKQFPTDKALRHLAKLVR